MERELRLYQWPELNKEKGQCEDEVRKRKSNHTSCSLGFPGDSEGKESACNMGDPGLIPRLGRSPGEGKGNPLQCSCLVSSVHGRAWWATVSGFIESPTLLSTYIAAEYFIVFMYHIFFIHSSVDGHLGCFHVLAIVNNTAANFGGHASLHIMVFLGYAHRGGIAGSYGS